MLYYDLLNTEFCIIHQLLANKSNQLNNCSVSISLNVEIIKKLRMDTVTTDNIV